MSRSALLRGARVALVMGATLSTVGGWAPRANTEETMGAVRARLHEAELRHGPQSPQAGDLLLELSGLLHANPKNLAEGTELARRALDIRERLDGPDSPRTADALDLLALWLWHGRAYQEERPLVERALRIRQHTQPVSEAKLAVDLHFLADLAFVEGDYGRARQLQEQVGPLWVRVSGPRSLLMATHLQRYAQVLDAIGDHASALSQVSRAIDIREAVGSPIDAELARSLNLLGRLCLETGALDRAEVALERARGIWEISGSPDRTDLAQVLRSLAQLAAARGDDARAVQLYRRVAEIRSAALGERDALMVPTLTELGAQERRSGLLVAARVSLRRALEIQEEVPDEESPPLPRLARELALLDRSEGALQPALEEALQAESLSREQFRKSALGLSEREALAQGRERVRGLDLAWDLAAAQLGRGPLEGAAVSRLAEEAIKSRALVLDTLAARQRTLALHPDAVTASKVEALRHARAHLTHLLLDGISGPADAQAMVDRAERALAATVRAYQQELERGQPGLHDVRRALPEASALLSYFRTDGAYVAMVLRPGDAPPRIVPLGRAAQIEAAVQAWSAAVSQDPRLRGVAHGEAAYDLAARSLGQKVWDPVAPLLAGVDHVLVVPDGALQVVSLATLLTESGQYLLDAPFSFHYLTAERDLVERPDGAAPATGLLALGDPAYGPGFAPLPGSRREVLELVERWSGAEPASVLLGHAARESAFKKMAPGFGVVHLATHAFLRTANLREESPLRVTGLALAEESGDDDGILTAEEVALLDLRAVRWAVLSACGTGQGVVEPGEGVLGLRRAFQIAGARTLIVSLWPVEDDATRHWMRALYDARRAGATTVSAVHDAMRRALEEQRRTGGTTHPYFWGGFVSIGDWR